ncbi:NADH-quinone oxidoreductase subunit A [Acetobacteraceae bacterium]|nr:NADH-quinone oxidoreductase subunit A [Acetobacteraceae bacterium]
MFTPTEIATHHWAFIAFCVAAVSVTGIMLLGGWLVGGRSFDHRKSVPFESGIDSVGSARIRFSAKFYLVAMFFVIFDVEVLYLYAWAVSIRETGISGFVEAVTFILLLFVGLIYLIRIGALDWTPVRSQRKHSNKSKIKLLRE